MKTLEEEILQMLGALNAFSKRGPHPPPPPGPHEGEEKPPLPPRGEGRGRLMGFLNDHGEMSQTQLATHLDIRPQSLSELIAKMESDGLVMRRQSDEDKRQTLVSLTDLGRSRVEAFRENHRRRAAEFLEPLTAEEKIALAAILRKLIDAKKEEEQTKILPER